LRKEELPSASANAPELEYRVVDAGPPPFLAVQLSRMAGRKPITEEQEPALLAALEQASARDALIVLASASLPILWCAVTSSDRAEQCFGAGWLP
jgi:hypothetical protein